MAALFSFVGGAGGPWSVVSHANVAGAPLAPVARLDVVEGDGAGNGTWRLRGVVSHLRYTTRQEVTTLRRLSPPLGRPEATAAAMIAIRKTAAWWDMPQDERREVFEERSRHTSIGLEYLPAIARRLHHGRDLGEPFDFVTWFEFAPADAAAFDGLLARLRASVEWQHVDREVDLRLRRDPS